VTQGSPLRPKRPLLWQPTLLDMPFLTRPPKRRNSKTYPKLWGGPRDCPFLA
jgi:hypothetical protein